jgi:hypothetical protein
LYKQVWISFSSFLFLIKLSLMPFNSKDC